jgi:hypothetical protein
MKQGEDLVIRGSISNQLYKGMQAIMDEVRHWDIGLNPIRIEADALVADGHEPDRSASFFSGGVDSFYTYLKHQEDLAEADRIDSFILVNGFDIDLHNNQLWERTLENISAIARADEVDLVVVKTNIKALIDPLLSWDYTHGGCLAAAGLFLRAAFHQIYIPASYPLADQIPWGSSLALDGNWSTERTRFVHDGTEATRTEKVIRQIARSRLALEHLRVCYLNVKGTYNCGKCDKCLRTMMNLYLAGALEKARTFPHHIDPGLVAGLPAAAEENSRIFRREILHALERENLAPDLQRALTASLDKTVAMKRSILTTAENRAKYLDHAYTRGFAYSVWAGLFGRKFS